jgi:EAL domain-containing protein (putative c-di-GMP-specific phosphodiesterase class I)
MSGVASKKCDLSALLSTLYGESDERFEVLAQAAGLDPKRDFRSRDLRALYFAAADLAGFDFTDSDLRGTALRLAARIDDKTIIAGALLDRTDADWYDARVRETPAIDTALVDDLRLAMDRQQFALVFQPKVALRGGTVTGAEALLRWQHHERGVIMPVQFVPLLEELDLIERVTLWMIETAIEQQRVLVRRGFDLTIAVNISPTLIERADFIDDCQRLVSGQAAALRFEINETAFIMDLEIIIRHIEQLATMGISIALDDYGTGYSSLNLLRRLPAQELKIDQSFVHRLGNDNADPLVVRSTIDLAHALGWEVTAEGVETASQLSLLTVMGCDAAQGYLIARPMGIEQLAHFLEAGAEIVSHRVV